MARKGSGALNFAAGFAQGAMDQTQRNRQDKERQEDRSMRKQEFDARMGEVNEQKQTRLGLADAARPAQVEEGAGGALRPDTMDNRDVGLPENASQPNAGLSLDAYRVKGKTFGTKPEAEAAATAANSPESVAKRQAQVLRQAGRPGDALAVETAQMDFSQKQLAYANKLKDEGLMQAGRALRSGDPDEVFETLNKTGKYKLDAPPVAKPVKMNVPGIGEVDAFEWEGSHTGPDGKSKPFKINSHEFSLHMLPYEKLLASQQKGVEAERKNENRSDRLGLAEATLAAKTAAAEAKATGGGGAGTSKEERLRYTSLFQEAGRRAGEAQKAITALQKDPEFARGLRRDPNGPQAQELNALKETAKMHGEERSLYQGLLAGGAKPGEGLADKVGPQAGRDGGRLEILQSELAAAQTRLKQGDTRAQGDIDALNREIAGTTKKSGAAPAAQSAKPAGAPVAVKTKAERDALPKGARYTGPDGQTYVKQ